MCRVHAGQNFLTRHLYGLLNWGTGRARTFWSALCLDFVLEETLLSSRLEPFQAAVCSYLPSDSPCGHNIGFTAKPFFRCEPS